MITAAEAGITELLHDDLKAAVENATWRLTAYRWNLKFDTTITTSGISNTGDEMDAINFDDTIYRVSDDGCHKLVADVWTEVSGFTALSGRQAPYSMATDGTTLAVFGMTDSTIQVNNYTTVDGWSGWSMVAGTVTGPCFVAGTSPTRVHVIANAGGTLWRFALLNYDSEDEVWLPTSSDLYWQYNITSFDAERIDGTDILLFTGYAPGNLSAKYVNGKAVKTTIPANGIFAIRYKYDWSDHFTVDIVDEAATYRTREQLRATTVDSKLYLVSSAVDGTQNYPFYTHRLYTTLDGKRWSRGEIIRENDDWLPLALLTSGDYVYGVQRSDTIISEGTLRTGNPHTNTILDITKEVQSFSLSRRDMALAQITLSNNTGWVGTSILNRENTVALKVEAGYWIDGKEELIQIALLEVDSIDVPQEISRESVQLSARDRLAWMASKTQSEQFLQWEPQNGFGDEYGDTTGTGYGGLGSSAIIDGAWRTGSNQLVLKSSNKEGLVFSTILSECWNAVHEHSFTLSQANNNEYAGLVWRGQDKDNFWMFIYDQATDYLRVKERSGGVDTLKWSSSSTMSWGSSPSTRHWLRVHIRYAKVSLFSSDDGYTWTHHGDLLMDGETPPTSGTGYKPSGSTSAKFFKGFLGVIGKGYSDEDTFDYTPPTYDPPSYVVPSSGYGSYGMLTTHTNIGFIATDGYLYMADTSPSFVTWSRVALSSLGVQGNPVMYIVNAADPSGGVLITSTHAYRVVNIGSSSRAVHNEHAFPETTMTRALQSERTVTGFFVCATNRSGTNDDVRVDYTRDGGVTWQSNSSVGGAYDYLALNTYGIPGVYVSAETPGKVITSAYTGESNFVSRLRVSTNYGESFGASMTFKYLAMDIHCPLQNETIIFHGGAADTSMTDGYISYRLFKTVGNTITNVSPVYGGEQYGVWKQFGVKSCDIDQNSVLMVGKNRETGASVKTGGVWLARDGVVNSNSWTNLVAPSSGGHYYCGTFAGDDPNTIWIWGNRIGRFTTLDTTPTWKDLYGNLGSLGFSGNIVNIFGI